MNHDYLSGMTASRRRELRENVRRRLEKETDGDLNFSLSGITEADDTEGAVEKSRDRGGDPDGVLKSWTPEGDREESDINYSLDGLTMSRDEEDRQALARAIADELADELDGRERTRQSDAVEKATQVSEDVRALKRVRVAESLERSYLADGGDREDCMADVLKWVDANTDVSVTVEDGSVSFAESA